MHVVPCRLNWVSRFTRISANIEAILDSLQNVLAEISVRVCHQVLGP